jgi:phage/plasmid-associated DNA primase
LLEGVFSGDEDAFEKRQLLAEIAGAAALGYRSKSWEPKAVILEGKTAENGKSQVLDLFRGLLPPDAVASIPAAKMGDERFVVGLWTQSSTDKGACDVPSSDAIVPSSVSHEGSAVLP